MTEWNEERERAEERERLKNEATNAPPERRETLWLLTFGPTIWAVHFVLSYVTAAVWCAKVAGRSGSLGGARTAIVIFTLLALAGVGLTLWRGFRQASFGTGTVPHDFDIPGDRHRFLGLATVLLCGLSAVAIIYIALTVVFIESCR